jgi:hypothetical protein
VLAVPVVLAVSTGVGAVALASLPLLPTLVKNLARIPRDSLESRVYETIATETGSKKLAPTLDQIKALLPSVNSDDLMVALENLRFEDKVIELSNGHFRPHAI